MPVFVNHSYKKPANELAEPVGVHPVHIGHLRWALAPESLFYMLFLELRREDLYLNFWLHGEMYRLQGFQSPKKKKGLQLQEIISTNSEAR